MTNSKQSLSVEELPFAEEFPHLTALGRAFRRFLIALCASMIVEGALLSLGVPLFMTGWIAGCTFTYATYELKALRSRSPLEDNSNHDQQ